MLLQFLQYNVLMLSMLGKIFSRPHFESFFFFIFPRKQDLASLGDNLHEMPNPVFWENKKNIISLSSAGFAHSMVKVNYVINSVKSLYHVGNFENSLTFKITVPDRGGS